jgi:hypothetical protein
MMAAEHLGSPAIPPLILGDHGFVRKYGSSMPVADIRRLMTFALDCGIRGLSAGDSRVLAAALVVAESRRPRPYVLRHADVGFLVNGRRPSFARCMATIALALNDRDRSFLSRDPLMGSFLMRYRRFRPYERGDTIQPDPIWRAGVLGSTGEAGPSAVSVGGDYLDALLVLGAAEPVLDEICALAATLHTRGKSIILTSYVLGAAGAASLAEVAFAFDAVMVPLNRQGLGVFPSNEEVRRELAAFGKPTLAMHALGSGAIPPKEALEYVFVEAKAATAVVGASSAEHITCLAAAAAPWSEVAI